MQRLRPRGFAAMDRAGQAPGRLQIAGGGVLDHPVRFRQLAIELGQPEGLHTRRAITVEGQQRIGIAGADLQQEKMPRLERRHTERFAFGAGDQWERMGVLQSVGADDRRRGLDREGQGELLGGVGMLACLCEGLVIRCESCRYLVYNGPHPKALPGCKDRDSPLL